jgi:precorrin-2 dehydrogenase/sirohydrochlorin ferrochelatase
MVQHYPMAVRLQGKECLVVGGGTVAYRKVASLLACGAYVRVVSPVIEVEMQSLVTQGVIQHQAKEVEEEDLSGVFLVIGATDQREVNRQVSEWAVARNLLVNIVDQPEDCNFIVPAVHRVGSLTLTVNTDGKSPALAARVRRELAEHYPYAYAVALEWLGEIRVYLLTHLADGALRRQILLGVVEGEWLIHLQAGNGEMALQWLVEHFPVYGDGESLWTRLHTIWDEMRDGF